MRGQFGHQIDVERDVFRRGAHPPSIALSVVKPHALSDPVLRHHRTDAIHHAGAVAAGHDAWILHRGCGATPTIGIRRVDPGGLEPNANFVAARLGRRQFTAHQNLTCGALSVVPDGAHDLASLNGANARVNQ